MHKKYDDYHECFTHNNKACKHPYKNNHNALIYVYSLVNGLCMITTESIKRILDVEQFGASRDLIDPFFDVHKVSHSSSMHSH